MSVFNDLTQDAAAFAGNQFYVTGRSKPITASAFNAAELGRVHQYFDENELRHPVMEITFPADYLKPPIALHVSQQLRHKDTGWNYVIRHVDAPFLADGQSFVYVLVATVTRPNS